MPISPYSPRKILIGLLVLAVLVIYPYLRSARQPRHYEFGGTTMGTYYIVKIHNSGLGKRAAKRLQEDVRLLLDAISKQMSTYDPESEISRFNRSTQRVAQTVSPTFFDVTAFALQLARDSDGAFDPTVMPLVELWGFGPSVESHNVPDDVAISTTREAVGSERVELSEPRALRKRVPAITLDLNAVAKGRAVDAVAEFVHDHECPNVFVDIGGEIRTFGQSAPNTPWRIAIEKPTLGAAVGAATSCVIELTDNRAIATSGDYRNYFVKDGRAYSHVIDPRTGYPVTNRVASVSIVAPTCMLADGLATALMVLGPDAGARLVAQYPGTASMIILREPDGAYDVEVSPEFPRCRSALTASRTAANSGSL